MSVSGSSQSHDGMQLLPGGQFLMGSNEFYPEERPLRWASVDPFWIDRTPVTNAEFKKFVEETGYVTVAETLPDLRDFPDIDDQQLHAGSAVFIAPISAGPVGPKDWWHFVEGASWKHPEGQGLCGMARQATAKRSRMGICSPRRTSRQALRLGRCASTGGTQDGEPLGGAFSARSKQAGLDVQNDVRGYVRSERVRSRGHGRQCLGMDLRPVHEWRRGSGIMLHC